MTTPIPLSNLQGEMMGGFFVTAFILDGQQVTLDAGALHGRAAVENGIQFTADRSTVADGRRHIILWVAIRPEGGRPKALHGAAASEMLIDRAHGTGWKVMAEHINRLAGAMRGQVQLEGLSAPERVQVQAALQGAGGGALWAAAEPAFRAAFGETA